METQSGVPREQDAHSSPCQGLVLMYHRVADVPVDPWGLCVSPRRFAAHLTLLASRTRPVRLNEIRTGGAAEGRLRVAVTFDDGYQDNLANALPLLERHRVPATIFVVAGAVTGGREFWWDELEQIVFAPRTLPERLDMEIDGAAFRYVLGGAVHPDTSQWRRDQQAGIAGAGEGTRLHLYRSLWEHLCTRSEDSRARWLHRLQSWSGVVTRPRPLYRPVDASELRTLAGSPWVEIGAHTVTHPRLPLIADEDKAREILEGKAVLEAITQRPVETFSYPFGQLDRRCVDLVGSAGFRFAVTTRPVGISAGTHDLQLGRLAVGDWDADRLWERVAAVAQPV